MAIKCIGILTSGGDAPGMNAAIRAVTRTAIYNGYKVKGIMRGYHGLVTNEIVEFKSQSVSNIIQKGGTILKTARSKEFRTPEGRQQAYENMKAQGIDALVVCGGDGSFNGALRLAELGIPCIGIPGTIDNDLAYTEMTLGYDTAVNTCADAVRAIRATSRSHDRPHVIEVMGRDCGDIALSTAAATGAEIVVVPEVKWSVDEVADKLNFQIKRGNTRATVVIAEGCWASMKPFDVYKFLKPYGKEVYEGEPMTAERLASVLKRKCGMIEVRSTVVGYTQRGASPTARDCIFAFEAGAMAVELLKKGISNQVIGMKNGKTFYMPIEKALAAKHTFNKKLYNTVNVFQSKEK